MCDLIIGAWTKFMLKNGNVVIGRVNSVEEELITIDNAAPTAGGFHSAYTFSKAEVMSCGPADPQKDVYREGA
jgi:hypothetical protein